MVFPSRVLLAVDGSRESEVARDRTADLVNHTHAELHVVQVTSLSPWTTSRTMSPDQTERLRTETRERLEQDVRVLRERGLDPRDHVLLGRVADEVLRLRDAIDADLVVVGSHGRHTLTRVLLGNDAESIVRRAPCPVLVVRRAR